MNLYWFSVVDITFNSAYIIGNTHNGRYLVALPLTTLTVNRSDTVSLWVIKGPVAPSLNVIVAAFAAHESLRAAYFLHVHAHVMSGQQGWLAGSNALYHAKLWIQVQAHREFSVLMKGIFSAFGSVKSPLLSCTGNKTRSCFFLFFFKFSRKWLWRGLFPDMKQKGRIPKCYYAHECGQRQSGGFALQ